MSINDLAEKIKGKKDSLGIVLIVVLVGLFSFGLGRLSRINSIKTPVKIDFPGAPATGVGEAGFGQVLGASKGAQSGEPVDAVVSSGAVVGSKNGDKYHFPWCSGAKRIKAENLVTFNSIDDAKRAGYTPAGNCKGLE